MIFWTLIRGERLASITLRYYIVIVCLATRGLVFDRVQVETQIRGIVQCSTVAGEEWCCRGGGGMYECDVVGETFFYICAMR